MNTITDPLLLYFREAKIVFFFTAQDTLFRSCNFCPLSRRISSFSCGDSICSGLEIRFSCSDANAFLYHVSNHCLLSGRVVLQFLIGKYTSRTCLTSPHEVFFRILPLALSKFLVDKREVILARPWTFVVLHLHLQLLDLLYDYITGAYLLKNKAPLSWSPYASSLVETLFIDSHFQTISLHWLRPAKHVDVSAAKRLSNRSRRSMQRVVFQGNDTLNSQLLK